MSYRVLHVTSSFPRRAGDPTAPFLLDLTRAQVAAGMLVTVVAPHDAALPLREELDGVDVVRARYAPDRYERLAYRGGLLATARDPWTAPLVLSLVTSLALAARRVAHEHPPDVVHAHWWLPGGLAARAVPSAPLVITLHGSDVGLAARSGIGSLGRAVTSRAAFVAAVSEPLLREARRVLRLDPEASGVVRMPIAVEPSSAAPPPPPPGPPWRLLAVGRASPEKGFDVLLDAVHDAVASTDLALEIVGAGPARPELEAQCDRLGLRRRVTFTDPLPRAVLYDRIGKAHVLVVPSRREGLGLVAVEALALGRPVIASRTGGLPEVVTPGAGLLVPPGDAAALAIALTTLPLAAPPMPAPAVERHAVDAVLAAHVEMYARAIG